MFEVNCPQCNRPKKPVQYLCQQKKSSEKICRSCRAIEISSRPEVIESRKDFIKSRPGTQNPFFGKKHTNETKTALKAIKKSDHASYHSSDFLAKMSHVSAGKKNPMFGKTVYDVWLSKYGNEEADRRETMRKAKLSTATSGANNPMFGKPSPTGSGNGWSGWYKGWYFRSLKELSFVINVIEAQSLPWVTGETIRIPYLDGAGKARTYSPDFIVSGTRMVEVKPTHLKSSQLVRLKQAAAEQYCSARGWTYEIIDPARLSDEEIHELYLEGTITLLPRYQKLFEARYLKP